MAVATPNTSHSRARKRRGCAAKLLHPTPRRVLQRPTYPAATSKCRTVLIRQKATRLGFFALELERHASSSGLLLPNGSLDPCTASLGHAHGQVPDLSPATGESLSPEPHI